MHRHPDETADRLSAALVATPATGHPAKGITWWRLVVATLARVTLLSAASLAVWAAVPAVIGWTPTTVMSGSMEPRIHTGDVVVSAPMDPAALRPGQVLLVDDPDHAARLRLHRLVTTTPDGRLVLRGDANANDDSTPVARSAVHGVGRLRVPYVATPVLWLHQQQWVKLAALLAALAALAAVTRLDRDDRGRAPTDDPYGRGTASPLGSHGHAASRRTWESGPTGTHLPGVAVGLVRSTAIMLVAGGLVLTPAAAGARWSASTTGPASTWAAARYFSCGNAVVAGAPSVFYRFDEQRGSSAQDSSTHDNDGSYSTRLLGLDGVLLGKTPVPCSDGGTAIELDGKAGSFLRGPSGYVSSKSVSTTDRFTIEIWFRTSSARGGRLIGFSSAATGESPRRDRHLYLTDDGKVVFGVYPADSVKTVTSPKTYRDGGWHLATASLSGDGMRLYVDGVQVAADPSVTTGEQVSNKSGYWRVGYDSLSGWPNLPSGGYAGLVDDAAVYPSALDPGEIAAHWRAASVKAG